MGAETFQTSGIAQLSYLAGHATALPAAVIDPRPHGGIYLDLAARHGLSITHAFETQVHADFMSGGRFAFGSVRLTARHAPEHLA